MAKFDRGPGRSAFGFSSRTNAKAVSRRIEALGRRFEVNVGEVFKQAATLSVVELYHSNPVDSGRSRSNWRTSIGTPNLKYDRGADSGANAMASQARAGMNGASYKTTKFYVSNSAPYIETLNRGSSPQAPAHWIRSAVKKVTYRLNRSQLFKRHGVNIY